MGFSKNVTLEDGIDTEDDNSIENMLTHVQQQEKIYTVKRAIPCGPLPRTTFRELCALNMAMVFPDRELNIQEGDQLIVTSRGSAGSPLSPRWRREEIPGTETTSLNFQEYHQGYHRRARTAAPRHHAERLRYQWRAAGQTILPLTIRELMG